MADFLICMFGPLFHMETTTTILAALVLYLYLEKRLSKRWSERRMRSLFWLLLWSAYVFSLTLATKSGLQPWDVITANAPKAFAGIFLLPVQSLVYIWEKGSIGNFLYCIIGNLLLLAPMGILVQRVFGMMRPGRMLCYACITAGGIELLQLFENIFLSTARQVDVTDFLLNVAGWMCVYAMAVRIRRNRTGKRPRTNETGQ